MEKRICIAIPLRYDLTFYREILCGVLDYAAQYPNISILHNSLEKLSALEQQQIDGFIDFIYDKEKLKYLNSINFPYINLTTLPYETQCNSVTFDNYQIGIECAKHFVSNGIKNLIMIGDCKRPYSDLRLTGINDELSKTAGICKELLIPDIYNENISTDSIKTKDLAEIIENLDLPVGIICQSPGPAMAIISAVKSMGLQCPEDIAVMSCTDDNIISRMSAPQITCLKQAGETVGFKAMELLHSQISENNCQTVSLVVSPGEIISRGSAERVRNKSQLILELEEVICRKFRENITVADVVRAFPLSRRTLEKRFRDETGYSIYEAIQKYCFNEAKNLLKHSSLSIKEVAHKSGFGSDQVMRKYFHLKLGLSPLSFRLK